MAVTRLLAPAVAVLLATLTTAPGALAARASKITEFSAGISAGSGLEGIAAGPDGNLWFTEHEGDRIGRITPSGAVTEFSAGISAGSGPVGITVGPEGDLWFTEHEGDRIGRITSSGEVTEFSKGIAAGSSPQAITTGQEGDLWFTENGANRIGRITPTGEVTQFEGIRRKSAPLDIATGPEGDLWFTEEGGNRIGRMTPAGEVSEFANGISGRPQDIATGPDGNLWFTDAEGHRLGRITPSGEATRFSSGVTPGSDPQWIAAGPDGNLWFAEHGGDRIGRIVSGAPGASVSAPALSGGAQVGKPAQCVAGAWASWAALQPSASVFAFDGYRWLLDGSAVATGQSYTPSASDTGHQLSCTETVTYPLLDVSVAATSAAATVVAVLQPHGFPRCCFGRGGLGGGVTLRLSAVTQSASAWREGGRLAILARAPGPPVGTTFSFTLNEAARVAFAFTDHMGGRKVKGKCIVATRKNSHAPVCQRTVTVGALAFAGHSGSNRLSFQGRVSRSRKLAPGRYTLRVTATNASGQRSQTRTVSFTIVH